MTWLLKLNAPPVNGAALVIAWFRESRIANL